MTFSNHSRMESWSADPGWQGVCRPCPSRDAVRLRGMEVLVERRNQIKKHLEDIQNVIDRQLELLFAFGPNIIAYLTPSNFGFWVFLDEQLRQSLRATSTLIAKYRVLLRLNVSSSKKAVYERSFFIQHETHPPRWTANLRGLFVGAFRTA
jgi:hypothetical protein